MNKMNATIRAAAIVKVARLGESFLAGVNPLGTSTVELGRQTDRSAYAPMQAASVLGGLAGGGLLIPGALGGLSALTQKRPGGFTEPLWRTMWEGAKKPFVDTYKAARGYGALRNYARKGIAPTADQQKLVSDLIMKNTSIADAQQALKKMKWTDKLRASYGAIRGKPVQMSQSLARSAMPAVRGALMRGGMFLGIPALISGLAAYTQYSMGQNLREKQRKERERTERLSAIARAHGYGGA